jgi:feruloyl esterase
MARIAAARSARTLFFGVLLIGAACGLSTEAQAALSGCTHDALSAAAPPGMAIKDIPNVGAAGLPATQDGVVTVPAGSLGDDAPDYCFVTGSVVTDPTSGKTANFAAALPVKLHWNGKFMFEGCGGNCGTAFLFKPPALLLRKGYPVFATDDGHIAKSSPAPRLWKQSESSWAVTSPGHRDEASVADFFYRAVHSVITAGKALTLKYYDTAALSRAYYEGCSDGGREGMVEVSRYPTDFDGVIAGDPYFDIGGEAIGSLAGIAAQLRAPNASLSGAQLSRIDQIVAAKCDAADGVVDGLIQNPAKCDFDPQQDLPKCTAASADKDCFTLEQIESVSAILSAVTLPDGKLAYPGYPVSNLNDAGPFVDNLAYWLSFPTSPDALQGPEPWAAHPAEQPEAWYWANQTIRYLIYNDAPGFNALSTPGLTFQAGSTGFHAVVPAATMAQFTAATGAGDGDHPDQAETFLKQGRKLILYHGLSDGDITPYRTLQYYEALAKLAGGYPALQQNARLFMVPGMAHCAAGIGPDQFGQTGAVHPKDGPENDVTDALEAWVEQGRAPRSIIATQYEQHDPKRAALRSMPLCPFPSMARYSGTGDVKDPAHWRCDAGDQRMLEIGKTGAAAGLGAD